MKIDIVNLLVFGFVVWSCFNIVQSRIFDFVRTFIDDMMDDCKNDHILFFLENIRFLVGCACCSGFWISGLFLFFDWFLKTNIFPFSEPKLFVFGMIFGSGFAYLIQMIFDNYLMEKDERENDED